MFLQRYLLRPMDRIHLPNEGIHERVTKDYNLNRTVVYVSLQYEKMEKMQLKNDRFGVVIELSFQTIYLP